MLAETVNCRTEEYHLLTRRDSSTIDREKFGGKKRRIERRGGNERKRENRLINFLSYPLSHPRSYLTDKDSFSFIQSSKRNDRDESSLTVRYIQHWLRKPGYLQGRVIHHIVTSVNEINVSFLSLRQMR